MVTVIGLSLAKLRAFSPSQIIALLQHAKSVAGRARGFAERSRLPGSGHQFSCLVDSGGGGVGGSSLHEDCCIGAVSGSIIGIPNISGWCRNLIREANELPLASLYSIAISALK